LPEVARIGDIGGLDQLKKWLLERRELFRMRDNLTQEIVPKGVLLMGIPGCGKSLAIKAIASAFELPLYRIDMVEIFSGRHGKPEGAFVEACRLLETWRRRFFGSTRSSRASRPPNPAGNRAGFSRSSHWMQEKAAGLFVAATANRIDLLPRR